MENPINNSNYEECVMHSKSDNIKIVVNDEEDEVKEKLF